MGGTPHFLLRKVIINSDRAKPRAQPAAETPGHARCDVVCRGRVFRFELLALSGDVTKCAAHARRVDAAVGRAIDQVVFLGGEAFELGSRLLVQHLPRTDMVGDRRLGRTLKHAPSIFSRSPTAPGTSTGPIEAINGRLEQLCVSALDFPNLTNYIARSFIESGGFRPHLRPELL